MKLKYLILSLSFFLILPGLYAENPKTDFYDFNANSIDGKTVSMKSYKGKVVLIVNTASKCGFTPQYEGLEALYKKYQDKGLVILGFPCNQFGGQEPGNESQILDFCKINYGVSFPLFSKIDVNGQNTHPLYVYLKTTLPGTLGNDIKWNFTKFLLDRKGKPIERYGSTVKPNEIIEDIEKLLK